MTKKYKALSIVYPGGQKIAQGLKTIEVRSWQPPADFTGDLLVVENHKFLRNDGDSDPAACASRWDPGSYSWELTDVRPIESSLQVPAERNIYDLEIDNF